MNKDTTATLAGSAMGVQMLMAVNYTALPSWAEFTKLGVAFSLMALGYFMYREKPAPTPAPPSATTPTQVA